MKARYRIDNSGVYHRAILRKGKSNIFRLSVKLNIKIEPQMLQKAVDAITPRFPTMAASIRGNFFHYYAVPVKTPISIQKDTRLLAYMPPKEIRQCAVRVLYNENSISAEFFHSLTDGHGGMVFMRSLLAEYLRLANGVVCTADEDVLLPDVPPSPDETIDSFLTYAGKKGAHFDKKRSYLPGESLPDGELAISTALYDTERLIDISHEYGVSLTTFLTAALAKAIMQLQTNENRKRMLPVQIMLPVNLRRRFTSSTLRNFTLYALPFMQPSDTALPFEELVKKLDAQLKEQLTHDKLREMMATNINLEYNWLMRKLPLAVKCAILKLGFQLFGARNSSLSLSNIGEWSFPPQLLQYIEDVSFYLSPRVCSPYNCSAVSFNGTLQLNITSCAAAELLEPVLHRTLEELGCPAKAII